MRIIYLFIGWLLTSIGLGIAISKATPPKERIVTDSVAIEENIELKILLAKTQDSLAVYKDTTISSDIFVLKYKLERIRYYNEVAAKGNNIKYLRGWINRILKE